MKSSMGKIQEKLRHGERQRAQALSFQFPANRAGAAEQQGGEVRGQTSHQYDNAVSTNISTSKTRPRTNTGFPRLHEVEAVTTPKAPVLPSKRQVTDPYGCWSEALLTEPGAVRGDTLCCARPPGVRNQAPGSHSGWVWPGASHDTEGLILSPGK